MEYLMQLSFWVALRDLYVSLIFIKKHKHQAAINLIDFYGNLNSTNKKQSVFRVIFKYNT